MEVLIESVGITPQFLNLAVKFSPWTISSLLIHWMNPPQSSCASITVWHKKELRYQPENKKKLPPLFLHVKPTYTHSLQQNWPKKQAKFDKKCQKDSVICSEACAQILRHAWFACNIICMQTWLCVLSEHFVGENSAFRNARCEVRRSTSCVNRALQNSTLTYIEANPDQNKTQIGVRLLTRRLRKWGCRQMHRPGQ